MKLPSGSFHRVLKQTLTHVTSKSSINLRKFKMNGLSEQASFIFVALFVLSASSVVTSAFKHLPKIKGVLILTKQVPEAKWVEK